MNSFFVLLLTLSVTSALSLRSDRHVRRELSSPMMESHEALGIEHHGIARREEAPPAEKATGQPPAADPAKRKDIRKESRAAGLEKRIKDLKARLAKMEAALAKLKDTSTSGDKPGKDGNPGKADKPSKEDKPSKGGKKPSKSEKATPTKEAPPATESPAPTTGPTVEPKGKADGAPPEDGSKPEDPVTRA